ncbi:MAG TPA: hypothetical protein VHI52_05780 [Verrucomicrobiae bacterium]|nr:hypothetical protein [Verrucomicrobiae bacterium]
MGEALSKTFDGKHPCSLCRAIQQGRAQEKKQDQPQTNSICKQDLGIVWQTLCFNFTAFRERVPAPNSEALSRWEPPPKPPPETSAQAMA